MVFCGVFLADFTLAFNRLYDFGVSGDQQKSIVSVISVSGVGDVCRIPEFGNCCLKLGNI